MKKILNTTLFLSFLVLALLSSCAKKTGITVDYSTNSTSSTTSQSTATPAYATPKPSNETTESPEEVKTSLPSLFGYEPFDVLGFAINSYELNSVYAGTIYSPLPDYTIIQVMIGWKDQFGEIKEQSSFFEVKNSKVEYSFLIDEIVPPQYIYLAAMLDMTDKEHEQANAVKSLLGINGELLPPLSQKPKGDGSMGLMNAWAVPFPNELSADTAIFSQLFESYPDTLVSVEWIDGEFVSTLTEFLQDPANTHELIADLKDAAKAFRPHEGGLDPAIKILDIDGNIIIEDGTHFVIDEPLGEVYISSSGSKYHKASCRYAKSGDPTPEFLAKINKYEPCKICH